MAARRFELSPDRKGAVWDLLLYVPTVAALATVGARLWFGEDRGFAYLLSFLASLFFLIGANRILKTRLMLLPTAPKGIELEGDCLTIVLRNARRVNLVKQQKLYRDMAGRSFGVSGLDREGRRLAFVFHRGQFADPKDYRAAQDALQALQPPTRA
jgi:hypothetical protein